VAVTAAEAEETESDDDELAAAIALSLGAAPADEPASLVAQPSSSSGDGCGGGLKAQVDQIKAALTMDPAMAMPAAIKEANAQMGLDDQGTLPEQVAKLMAALGI
jgi:hypothetical protein